MSIIVWALVGIALWRFTVLLPDRFHGGIIGAFLYALGGAVLGGWALPGGISESLRESGSTLPLQILELTMLLVKTFLLMVAVVLVARVTPRVRSDQVTDFAWKVLSITST